MKLTALVTDPDDRTAYENTRKMADESALSDQYYQHLAEFAALLDNKKSYVRTRAMILCCAQARWDTEGQLVRYLPKMLRLLHDEKPTVVRQSLNALRKVVVFRPELREAVENELDKMEFSTVKESMIPLIRKDAAELRALIGEKKNPAEKQTMGKYGPLWKWIKENGTDRFKLTFAEIESILGFPIDHAFLTEKKELRAYGYQVGKISMKEQTAAFEKIG